MSQPSQQAGFQPPWFLIVGLLAGIVFVGYVVYDSTNVPGKGYSPNVVEFTRDNWKKEVLDSDIPVVVDFTATWCGPCKRFAPTLAKLADRYQGRVKVGKYDVGDMSFSNGRHLQDQYGITGVPHVMIFSGSQPPMQFPGAGSEAELASAIDSVLAKR
jgi:thioredoxin 1